MPQLDKFSFMPQIFWLIIIFFILYFLLLNIVLPQLYSVIKTRTKILVNMKNLLLHFGDKEIILQKKYIENINFFVVQTNLCFAHLRYLFDTNFFYIQKYIKNVIHF